MQVSDKVRNTFMGGLIHKSTAFFGTLAHEKT